MGLVFGVCFAAFLFVWFAAPWAKSKPDEKPE